MLAGGLFFLFADNLFRDPEIKDEKEVNYLTALRIGELITEAGFPDGVVNILAGFGPTSG